MSLRKAIDGAWQPAETAPKDGQKILICWGMSCFIHIAHWSDEATFERFEVGPGWQVFECDDGYYSFAIESDRVNYWMPLPDLPDD